MTVAPANQSAGPTTLQAEYGRLIPAPRSPYPSIRVPSRLQPWDNAHNIEGGLKGVGLDGRPIVPERFRAREPFLVVEAEDVHTFGAGGRVKKPHERADCGPARRRREIQARTGSGAPGLGRDFIVFGAGRARTHGCECFRRCVSCNDPTTRTCSVLHSTD